MSLHKADTDAAGNKKDSKSPTPLPRQSSATIQSQLLKEDNDPSPRANRLLEIEKLRLAIKELFVDATATVPKFKPGKNLQHLNILKEKIKMLEAQEVRNFSAEVVYYTKGNMGYGHVALRGKYEEFDAESRIFKEKKFYRSFDRGSGIGTVADKITRKPEEEKSEDKIYIEEAQGIKFEIPLPTRINENDAEVSSKALKKFSESRRNAYSKLWNNCADKIIHFLHDGSYVDTNESVPTVVTPEYAALCAVKINLDLLKEQQDLLVNAARFALGSEEKLESFVAIINIELQKIDYLKIRSQIMGRAEDIFTEEKCNAQSATLTKVKQALESKNYALALNHLISFAEIPLKGITKELEPILKHFPYELIPKSDTDNKRLFLKNLYTDISKDSSSSTQALRELLKSHESQDTGKMYMMFFKALHLLKEFANKYPASAYAHWHTTANKMIAIPVEPSAQPAIPVLPVQPPALK